MLIQYHHLRLEADDPLYNILNNLQAYRPGETISGAVEFTLTEPKCYDCIKVDFLGSAHVEWGGKTRYLSDELYVQDSCLLWSPQHGNGSSIGPGSLSFPFQFVIPSHVPSSFHQQNTSLLTTTVRTLPTSLKLVLLLGCCNWIIRP